MKKKTKKQIGIENFGKRYNQRRQFTKREIPDFLKSSFDDPDDINWGLVDAFQKTVKNFMKVYGDELCEFIKDKTGETVYWTPEGKIYKSKSVSISPDEFEKMFNEFVYEKVKAGEL